MLAFNDIYRTIAIALIPLIPLFLLFAEQQGCPSAISIALRRDSRSAFRRRRVYAGRPWGFGLKHSHRTDIVSRSRPYAQAHRDPQNEHSGSEKIDVEIRIADEQSLMAMDCRTILYFPSSSAAITTPSARQSRAGR